MRCAPPGVVIEVTVQVARRPPPPVRPGWPSAGRQPGRSPRRGSRACHWPRRFRITAAVQTAHTMPGAGKRKSARISSSGHLPAVAGRRQTASIRGNSMNDQVDRSSHGGLAYRRRLRRIAVSPHSAGAGADANRAIRGGAIARQAGENRRFARAVEAHARREHCRRGTGRAAGAGAGEEVRQSGSSISRRRT